MTVTEQDRDGQPIRWGLVVGLAAAVVVVFVAVSTAVALVRVDGEIEEFGESLEPLTTLNFEGLEGASDAARRAAWAGFTDTDGLTLSDVRSERGIDEFVSFRLVGDGPAAEAALLAADFATPFTPGMDDAQASLFPDLDPTGEVHFATDVWTSPAGLVVHRQVARINFGEAQELHVRAFTT